MSNPGMRLTSAGKKILAQGLLGDEIHFTKIAFGDADFDYDTEDLTALTALKSWKLDLPLIDKKLNGDGTVTIVGLCTNFALAKGFQAKEIGIFAIDQDTSTEILYAYRNAGDEYSFIPAKMGVVTKSVRYAYQIEIGDAENVTFDINFSFAYVSQEEFKAHVDGDDSHPELFKLARENRQIIQAQVEMPFDANLFIFEDFWSPSFTDNLKVQVTNCVAGSNLITLASIDGFKIGEYYWIYDGTNYERVKITSAMRLASGLHVKTSANLANSYDLTSTYIYRSTLGELYPDGLMPLELFTVKESSELDLTQCAAVIRHSELIDAELEATALLYPEPQKRENITLGAGGVSKIFSLSDANIDHDSLKVYVDNVLEPNYFFETDNAYIQLTASTGSTVTASYSYGGQPVEISLSELDTYREDDHFITRFIGESLTAYKIAALSLKVVRLAEIEPDEQPKILYIAAGFGN